MYICVVLTHYLPLLRHGNNKSENIPNNTINSRIQIHIKVYMLCIYIKNWLVQCQDDVTSYSGSWCSQPALPVGQHYKVTMSDKSEPVLI